MTRWNFPLSDSNLGRLRWIISTFIVLGKQGQFQLSITKWISMIIKHRSVHWFLYVRTCFWPQRPWWASNRLVLSPGELTKKQKWILLADVEYYDKNSRLEDLESDLKITLKTTVSIVFSLMWLVGQTCCPTRSNVYMKPAIFRNSVNTMDSLQMLQLLLVVCNN